MKDNKTENWTDRIVQVETNLSTLVPEVRSIAKALLGGADVEEDAANAFLGRLMDLGQVATQLLPVFDSPSNRRLCVRAETQED